MLKFGDILEWICDKAVKMMIFVIAGILAFWASRYTYFYPKDYSIEYAAIAPDSALKNFMVFVASLLVLYGLKRLVLRGTQEEQKKRVLVYALITVFLVGGVLFWYVLNTHIYPYWDQAQVYLDALSFKAGDYSDIQGYLVMYPQQYGLTFFYELMFWVGPDNYITIECFNVLFVMILIFFGYRLTEELFHDPTINFYTLIALTLFLPMHIYTNFVYGDLPSTALAIVGIWGILRWYNKTGLRYIVISLICFSSAYLFRKNSLIVLVAVALLLCIGAIKKRSLSMILICIMVIVVPMTTMAGVKYSYELRSGYEIGDGIPANAWIAMGMQKSDTGCGIFTGYTESIFHGEGEANTEKTAVIADQYIKERLDTFINNPTEAIDFYKAKIQCQWIEPTFSSLIMTSKYLNSATELTAKVYSEAFAGKIISFMNYYNFILYAGVFCYALLTISRKDSIIVLIVPVTLIGGFLFSILWEAKGRYVMPYIIFMIPYMACGLFKIQITVKSCLNKAFVSCNLRK